MPRAAGLEKKEEYIQRLFRLLNTYNKVLIVQVDMVTSNQIQQVRKALRNKAEVLMGKNTLIRKGIRQYIAQNPGSAQVEKLLPAIKTNVGLVFTKDDLSEVRDVINSKRVPAPARVGVVAPSDVIVPKQQTTLEPTQTSFFQALAVATKINKGAIEILNDVHIIKKGEKVGASESALLAKLNIKPFTYGLELESVYDNGAVYLPKVLDLTDDDLAKSFASAVSNIAAIGLQVGFPTLASLPYSINTGFRNVLSLALEVDFDIPQLAALKAAQSAAKAAPVATTAAPVAAAAATKVVDKAPSEEEDIGLSLFD